MNEIELAELVDQMTDTVPAVTLQGGDHTTPAYVINGHRRAWRRRKEES